LFAFAYGSLGMLESAATWGAGACIFLLLAVAMALARQRALGDTTTAAVETNEKKKNLDVALIAAVSVVWTIFALAYGALGMSISAATWGAGAWLFITLTAGLVIAGRRGN
jgi:hypothetical protein